MGKQFPFRKLHVVPVLVVARIVVVLQIVGAFDIVVVIVLIFVIVRTVVDLHVNLHQIIDSMKRLTYKDPGANTIEVSGRIRSFKRYARKHVSGAIPMT